MPRGSREIKSLFLRGPLCAGLLRALHKSSKLMWANASQLEAEHSMASLEFLILAHLWTRCRQSHDQKWQGNDSHGSANLEAGVASHWLVRRPLLAANCRSQRMVASISAQALLRLQACSNHEWHLHCVECKYIKRIIKSPCCRLVFQLMMTAILTLSINSKASRLGYHTFQSYSFSKA